MTYWKTFYSTFAFLFYNLFSYGQQSIDKAVEFPAGSGTFRKYSVYVPSNYDSNLPNALMLGMHPLDPGVWTGKTWRDELKIFAEGSNLLLICPDGGPDGRVDDATDYDFTGILMDSMQSWYKVDPSRIFAIGFSVGGKAVYEFGLKYHALFKGFIPIGAAVNGTTSFDADIQHANCKNYFIIHGDKDNPNARFYPVKNKLEQNHANVDAILMAGIGHSITFPNRDQILKAAFLYVDTVSCDFTGLQVTPPSKRGFIYPNPENQGRQVRLSHAHIYRNAQITIESICRDAKNQKLDFQTEASGDIVINTSILPAGIYFLRITIDGVITNYKVLIL